ncbi:MAG: anhydro-N-acetylmuramic acid kinase [Alphaproteobacteria bacterium]|nr:anhydro-N-acetylmuramic acid kinase [Alphaproteobacteria bacterium]
MKKYQIIGCMTGNSMDAVDLVLTEFEGEKMKDICSFSLPFTKEIQQEIETLRAEVFNKTRDEILRLSDFETVHNEFVRFVAKAVNEMCQKYKLNKNRIDAIGFHGKTLDHYPPSIARKEGKEPYTLQIGSGKMLADLTGIKVVYDFRSEFVMKGFEGAPLIGPHNAHIARLEGDGIYFNGGNTSNFAIVQKGKVIFNTDCGPFNEYVDSFMRAHTSDLCDFNGQYGLKGSLDTDLLARLFDVCKGFYETKLPRSGDPQLYNKLSVFQKIKESKISFNVAVHTLEYFSAYIAALSLAMVDRRIDLPSRIVLFGGGWKNPVVLYHFEKLISGEGYILPEHRSLFEALWQRFPLKVEIRYSSFGEMMEARLMADMAFFKLENKPWPLPEVQNIVAGKIAFPGEGRYDDMINAGAKNY